MVLMTSRSSKSVLRGKNQVDRIKLQLQLDSKIILQLNL